MALGNKAKTAASLAASLLILLEGYGAKPYLDSAGVLTDCYGNTHNVSKDHVRTQAECKDLLNTEAGRLAAKVYKDAPDIPKRVAVATISWAYNVGDGAYATSTLRRKLLQGDWQGACDELPRWIKITVMGVKITLPGLVNRRDKEYAVCTGSTPL